MLKMPQTTQDATGPAELKLNSKALDRDGESVVAFDHMVSPDSGQDDPSEASLKGKFQGIELQHFST